MYCNNKHQFTTDIRFYFVLYKIRTLEISCPSQSIDLLHIRKKIDFLGAWA